MKNLVTEAGKTRSGQVLIQIIIQKGLFTWHVIFLIVRIFPKLSVLNSYFNYVILGKQVHSFCPKCWYFILFHYVLVSVIVWASVFFPDVYLSFWSPKIKFRIELKETSDKCVFHWKLESNMTIISIKRVTGELSVPLSCWNELIKPSFIYRKGNVVSGVQFI